MQTYKGIPASPGHAVGPVHRIRKETLVPPVRAIADHEVEGECARFEAAVGRAKQEIGSLVAKLEREVGAEEAAILGSQLLVLEDELTWDKTLAIIRQKQLNAEAAFSRAIADIILQLHDVESPQFRERIVDLRDVEERVLAAFEERRGPATPLIPALPSVIAARNLTPSDTAAIGRQNVLAFVMDEGGQTSHVAILARSIGVPAVVGLGNLVASLEDGVSVAVDGESGEVVVAPASDVRDRYSQLSRQQSTVDERLAHLRELPAETPDGHRVRLTANIELPVEVDEALARGAEGVGLLRTEYLYFQHGDIPTEDEQVETYTDIIRRMGGRPVTFRTLDVGGDKVSGYLGAHREYNPFLGWRGIRFSLTNRTLFKSQVRAIYRAAAAGPVKIMFPMITGIEELRAAKDLCLECRFELNQAGLPHAAQLPLGIMMETPSAALIADLLAAECDFFSLGTNDLIQYTLAMDRGNSRVSYLYRPLHPAMLRSLQGVVAAAHAGGIEVSLCGEMGSETKYAEVLLGLGLDEISLHGAALPKIKQVVRWTPYGEAQRLVQELAALPTAAEADAHLAQYIARKKAARASQGGAA
jgi:phosphotransferase system enzyme I (PtsI)